MSLTKEAIEKQEKKLCFKVNGKPYKAVGVQANPYMINVRNLRTGQQKYMNPKIVHRYLPIIWNGVYNPYK